MEVLAIGMIFGAVQDAKGRVISIYKLMLSRVAMRRALLITGGALVAAAPASFALSRNDSSSSDGININESSEQAKLKTGKNTAEVQTESAISNTSSATVNIDGKVDSVETSGDINKTYVSDDGNTTVKVKINNESSPGSGSSSQSSVSVHQESSSQ